MPDSHYYDFEIRVGAAVGSDYPVVVVASPAGESAGTLRLSLDEQSELLGGAVLGAARGVSSLAAPSTGGREAVTPEALGSRLFSGLIADEIYNCYHASLLLARKEGRGLRLRLRLEAPELALLPWETLFDERLKREHLCLSRETPLVRHVELTLPREPLALEPPVRILGMVGAREGLDAERERQLMGRSVEHLTDSGTASLEWVEGHGWRDLQAALRRGPWHVLHFIGHGLFEPSSGEGQLLLEDERGAPAPLPARELATLLADHPSLRLVLLNCCEGGRGEARTMLSSTAAVLAGRGLPAVVSMQYEISDRAAVELARTFYDSLLERAPVDSALAEARKSIRLALAGSAEWATPVLHMRAPDGTLFEVDEGRAIFRDAAPPARPAAPSGSSVGVPGGLDILRRRVRQYWVDGVLARATEELSALELESESISGAVDNPWGQSIGGSDGGGRGVEEGQTVGEAFAELGGAVLVLGDPGSGKTIALLQMARDLLSRFAEDPEAATPVVVPLSSWGRSAGSVADWLVDELAAKYMIPKRVGRAWLGGAKLVPLLDGLDEVAGERRGACIEAINQLIRDAPVPGLAVTCRLREYLDQPERLALNGAIRMRTLRRRRVLDLVAEGGPQLATLLGLLQRDSALLLEARSPLMLDLLVRAYRGLDASAAPESFDTSLAERRRRVMEAYVERCFGASRERRGDAAA